MSLLHGRCESLEETLRDIIASLRARVGDLEQEGTELREAYMQAVEEGSRRERLAVDRLLAVTNPQAAAQVRALTPAAPVPPLSRAGRSSLPQPGSRAIHTPAAAGFAPDVAARSRFPRPPASIAESLAVDAAGPGVASTEGE